jgi:hypothetical protein
VSNRYDEGLVAKRHEEKGGQRQSSCGLAVSCSRFAVQDCSLAVVSSFSVCFSL